MKTYTPKADDIERRWWLVDAGGVPLGRLASKVAGILRGKHKPMYTPHLDTGDHVIVVHAEKVRLTGRKAQQKEYFSHSGWMGGDRSVPFEQMIEQHPERVVERAVKGMLPKNNLGRDMGKKLRVYAGAEHPHESQQPEPLEL